MHDGPPTITTAQLGRLVNSAEPLWLIYLPDDPGSFPGHIAGSLAANDEDLLAALAGATPMVFYGEHSHAVRARTLAARLTTQGRDARWYAGGLQAWSAAGLPIEGQPGSSDDPGDSQ
jgi:hypothetical protein